MNESAVPLKLNHYQLKSLLKNSEIYGFQPADVQSVMVVYRAAEDSKAYAGPGLYSILEGGDLEEGAYLALDSQDNDRAIAIYEAQQELNLREYMAIEESLLRDDTIECKSRAFCIRQHHATWQFRVPSEVKSCKRAGRCLCDEFRQAEVEIELEIPLEGKSR